MKPNDGFLLNPPILADDLFFTVPSTEDYYDVNETKLEVKVRINTTGTEGLVDDETDAWDGNDTKCVLCQQFWAYPL